MFYTQHVDNGAGTKLPCCVSTLVGIFGKMQQFLSVKREEVTSMYSSIGTFGQERSNPTFPALLETSIRNEAKNMEMKPKL